MSKPHFRTEPHCNAKTFMHNVFGVLLCTLLLFQGLCTHSHLFEHPANPKLLDFTRNQFYENNGHLFLVCTLTLTVPVTTIDALQHFETG